jgi:osmotically-inducible protein OsmY
MNNLIINYRQLTCLLALLTGLTACVSTTPERDQAFGKASATARQQMQLHPDYGSNTDEVQPMVTEMQSGIRAYQTNTILNNSGKPTSPSYQESITSGN